MQELQEDNILDCVSEHDHRCSKMLAAWLTTSVRAEQVRRESKSDCCSTLGRTLQFTVSVLAN